MTAADRAILEAELAGAEAKANALRARLLPANDAPDRPRKKRRPVRPIVPQSDTDRAAAEKLARDFGIPVPRKAG